MDPKEIAESICRLDPSTAKALGVFYVETLTLARAFLELHEAAGEYLDDRWGTDTARLRAALGGRGKEGK
jgi:hypothetical protein